MSNKATSINPDLAVPRDGLSIADECEITVAADRRRVWDSLVNHLADWFGGGMDSDMHFRLEPRVGGRLFRDLSTTHGEGAGHLWGWVQVFKPEQLLELIGPMPISGPGNTHVTFRLTEEDAVTRVTLTSLTFGPVPPLFESMGEGWNHALEGLKEHAEHN